MDRPTSAEATLTQSDLLSSKNDSTVTGDLLRSAAYSALQAPVSGVAQIVDKTFDTQVQKSLDFIAAPAHAEAFSARWHAQQIGGAAGMVAPFLLLHKGVGATANLAFGKVEAEMGTSVLAKRVIGEAAVTGALYEGIFRPVTPADDFLAARTRNAAVGAATFATLAAGAVGLKEVAKAELGMGGRFLRNDVVASVLAGLPAGAVNAELSSVLAGKGHASMGQVGEHMYSFALAGGTLSLGKTVFGGTKAEGTLRDVQRQESAQAIADGAPTLGERASMALNDARSTVAAMVEGPVPALAGVTVGGGRRGGFTPDHAVFMSTEAGARGGGKPLRGGLGGDGPLIPDGLFKDVPVAKPTESSVVVPGEKPSLSVPVEKPAAVETAPVEKPTVAEKPAEVAAKPTVIEKPAEKPTAPVEKPAAQVEAQQGDKPAAVVEKPADVLPPVEKPVVAEKPVDKPAADKPADKPEATEPRRNGPKPGDGRQGDRQGGPREKPGDRTVDAKPTDPARQAYDKATEAYEQAREFVREAAARDQLVKQIEAAKQRALELEKQEVPPEIAVDEVKTGEWWNEQQRKLERVDQDIRDMEARLERGDRQRGYVSPERPLRSVAEAVDLAVKAVEAQPTAMGKMKVAKDAAVALEAELGRIPNGFKGADGKPDLPRFGDLPPKDPAKVNPIVRLNDLNKHLEAKVAELNAKEIQRRAEAQAAREAKDQALLDSPVVKDVMTKAAEGKLHPHPDAIVVFMSGNKAIQFQGPKGRQAGFSLTEAKDPAIIKERLGGQEVTSAVVFMPNKKIVNHRPVTTIRASKVMGDAPKGVGNKTLREFLDAHGEQR
jgi:hypothetical protein